jgi:hypothetical protein
LLITNAKFPEPADENVLSLFERSLDQLEECLDELS